MKSIPHRPTEKTVHLDVQKSRFVHLDVQNNKNVKNKGAKHPYSNIISNRYIKCILLCYIHQLIDEFGGITIIFHMLFDGNGR